MKSLAIEHLPVIASARGGVKKLRKLILQLAVMGRLVPQDSSDEPAHSLLKRILEKKRSGPSSVSDPMIAKNDRGVRAAFEAPGSWVWTNLEEVAIVNPRNVVPDDVVASFVPMNLIGTTFSGQHEQQQRVWKEIKQGFTHFADGDIGIAKITPCFENGKSCVFRNLTNGVGAGTTELHIVRTLDGTIDPRYVLAYFQSPAFLELGESKMTGTAGQKRLPKDFVRYNPFPLPPLAEQHRIVAKVDELMALCDKLEAQQNDSEAAHSLLVKTLLDTLTQTQDADDFAASWARIKENFHTLFTTEESVDILKQTLLQLAVMGKLVPQDPNDEPASELLNRLICRRGKERTNERLKSTDRTSQPSDFETGFTLPGSWKWIRFGELADAISTGPFGSMLHQSDYIENGVPVINPSHMIKSEIVPNHSVTISEQKAFELASYRLIAGDLVMARRGEVGRAALVRDNAAGWICGTGSFIVRFNPELNRRFILLLLQTQFVRKHLDNESVGTTMTNLNHSILRNLPTPVPPLAEQHRIVAKVDELMALCDKLKLDIQAADRLQDKLSSAMLQRSVDREPMASDSKRKPVLSKA